MKILLVSEFVAPVRGGLEQHVSTLSAYLQDRGHSVRVATLTDNPAAIAERVYSLPSLSRLLPHERADRPFHVPMPDLVSRAALKHIVREFRPDVIHAHNWLGVSVPRSDAAQVMTLHDYSLVCQLRTLFDQHEQICSGPAPVKCLRCGAEQVGAARSLLLAPATVFGRSRLHLDAVVAVSSAVARAVEPLLGQPIDVVPNFVAAQPEIVTPSTPFPPAPIVMYAGDSGPHKGLTDLLEAWALRATREASLVIATTAAPAALGAADDSVHLVSFKPNEMAAAWQQAAVAVVPSRWAEPCPTVVLEAKRAGLPVVATSVGGIVDLVEDGVDGLLVPARRPAELAAALDRVLASEQLRARLGHASLASSERFTIEAVGGRLLHVYDRALTTKGAVR